MSTETAISPVKTQDKETAIQQPELLETPDDIRALQALSLYGRRLPIPLIQQQLGVARSTAYKLIARGRELVGIDPKDVIPKSILLMDDLIRESLVQIQHVQDDVNIPAPAKGAIIGAIRGQINGFVMTQINAAKLALAPEGKTTTVTLMKNAQGDLAMQLVEEPKSVKTLMDEIKAKKTAEL